MGAFPLVDVAPLLDPAASPRAELAVGRAIDAACRDSGFLLVTGHGIEPGLRDDLERLSREFFALPNETKAAISMRHGALAWRGWFPVGDELTSGEPDRKEGVYFGQELPSTDPRVTAGTPLHGANLFPTEPAGLREVVLRWIDEVGAVGQALLRGIALGLGIDRDWFQTHLTADPTVLFRIFRYPPGDTATWGVGEHTDYGLVTLLAQDHHGGLQVRTRGEWVDVPADPYVFVVNIGDMLERMTHGLYLSNPHRVRNLSGQDRLSFPLFLDPSWDARVTPLPETALAGTVPAPDNAAERWDGQSVHAWDGTYGDYLTAKVAKVFPDLAAALRERPA
jgi:isopenicillin N synthase-like dioxygenase